MFWLLAPHAVHLSKLTFVELFAYLFVSVTIYKTLQQYFSIYIKFYNNLFVSFAFTTFQKYTHSPPCSFWFPSIPVCGNLKNQDKEQIRQEVQMLLSHRTQRGHFPLGIIPKGSDHVIASASWGVGSVWVYKRNDVSPPRSQTLLTWIWHPGWWQLKYFLCSPDPWGRFPIWHIFSKGVVQPPSRYLNFMF